MPKTLLVPLDGSPDAEVAMPVAEELAERFGAEIVVVAAQLDGVIPTGRPDIAKESVHAYPERTEIVRSASVADAVRTVADDTNDPVVCMATHARSTLGHMLFGSVAEDVVRALATPAVLVGPECSPTLRLEGPLLVCVDGSVESNAIVPIAREWALALGYAGRARATCSIRSTSRPRPGPNHFSPGLSKHSGPRSTSRRVGARLLAGDDDRRTGRRPGTCTRRDRHARAYRAGARRPSAALPPQWYATARARSSSCGRPCPIRATPLPESTRRTPRCVHCNSSALGSPPNSVMSSSRSRGLERCSSASVALARVTRTST